MHTIRAKCWSGMGGIYGQTFSKYIYDRHVLHVLLLSAAAGNLSDPVCSRSGENGNESASDNFTKYLIEGPMESRCYHEYCKALGWTGDMDLVGIGVHLSNPCLWVPSLRPFVLTQQQVFTSYYVEAVQVTIFLVAFSVWHMRQYATSQRNSRSGLVQDTQYHHEPPTRISRLGVRAIGAFRSSLNAFLGTSMLFSIAMLAAALYMSGKGTAQRISPLGAASDIPTDSALYDMMLSMLAATFSVLPVMILYAMQRRESDFSFKKRENQVWVSRAVLVLIWLLGAAEVWASLYGNFDYDYREFENAYHVENCDWRGSVHYWDGSKSFRSSADRPPRAFILFSGFLF